ncbi:ATP-dependent RNA helicase DDX24 [Drosophila sechellia]|uniref:ATP-dependent RNA helicase n=1 Tax=Drosophila sechellia TaxID=7238 RepID=B4HQ54_DROSE|nr:ATP-dependent RNA helicase DDX24 [Drosophila sechellia]EDW48679.1 GM19796 [Drosophila sechellia]
MVQNKQKTAKPPKLLKGAAKEPALSKAENWQKVKIKGHVISDDCGGYEGLIGLEVLKDYDASLVKSSQKRTTSRNPDRERTLKKKKRKVSKGDEQESSESSTESESEDEVAVAARTSKKARLAERHAQKMQKLREKREKRKELRKQKKSKGKENDNSEESSDEHAADRFALLRPPPSDDEAEEVAKAEDSADQQESSDEEAPELVSIPTDEAEDVSAWNGLGVPASILRALGEQGFKTPTQIQALTLPAAIHGKKDILGAAETGSGKTLAFGIPMLAGIMELKQRNIRSGIRKAPKVKGQQPEPAADEHELTPPPEELDHVSGASDEESDAEEHTQRVQTPLYGLVLTPTRELAVQVKNHLVAAAKYTGIRVAAIFGGLAVAKQERVLRQCPDIVVATPGRLWELYAQGNRHLGKIEDVSFLVIDETDRMVEKGHFEELRSLLKVLNSDEQKKHQRQNFVYSATLTLVHDLPDHMQKRNVGKRPKFVKQTVDQKIESLIEELGISQPKIVDITSSQQTAQTLTESRLLCPIDHKDYHLYYFIQRHPGRTIVFCNSIDCVKRLATLFGLLDCNPLPLHANMIQKQRLKNLERFRDSPTGLLIATDVAARGLDIPNVEHVIHYQVPRTSENYVHRSGRTARANKHGITVMFMEPGEVKSYVKLYKTLERTEDLPLFPISERFLGAVRERVNLARDLDKEELKLKRVQSERGWMKKHAEEMDMIIDGYNDESGSDQDEDPFVIERRRNRLRVETVRAQLNALLAQPIFPRGFSFKYPNSEATQLATSHTQSAVETMKAAIEDQKQAKKDRNKRKRNA